MYFNKVNIWKLLMVLGGILSVIMAFALIVGGSGHIIQKRSTTLQEKTEDPDAAVSNKNGLRVGNRLSQEEGQTADLGNLKQHQSLLSRKIKTLESTVSGLIENMQSNANGDGYGNKETDLDYNDGTSEEEEEILSQIRAQLDFIHEKLQSESVDMEWSDSTIKALYAAVQQKSPIGDLEILNVDCRSTLCRVDLIFNTDLPEDSFRELRDLIPWNGEGFFHVGDTDTREAVVYIAREGFSLPRL